MGVDWGVVLTLAVLKKLCWWCYLKESIANTQLELGFGASSLACLDLPPQETSILP